MDATMFSYKGLAVGWAALLGLLGTGALALQLTQPPTEPPVVVAAAMPQPVPVPAVEAAASPPVVVPPALPVPFENRSLLAMLPPPSWHPPPRHASALPLPPVPPARRVAQATPRREVRVYAAAPADEPADWGRVRAYPGFYARGAVLYGAPRTYYGW